MWILRKVIAAVLHLGSPLSTYLNIHMKMPKILLSAALICTAIASHGQIVVLAPGSSWEYTTVNPTTNSTWTTSTGGWAVGQAPFGNDWGHSFDSNFYPKTNWPVNNSTADDFWVRTTLNLAGFDLNTINWNLGADNGYTLFLNGHQISNNFAEGYTYRWEYSGSFGSSILNSGINYLAVALNDTGGMTAFDMQVTGRHAASQPVPEPSTYGLLGAAGLLGLAVLRRRRAV
jgi:hypothetical protein